MLNYNNYSKKLGLTVHHTLPKRLLIMAKPHLLKIKRLKLSVLGQKAVENLH